MDNVQLEKNRNSHDFSRFSRNTGGGRKDNLRRIWHY